MNTNTEGSAEPIYHIVYKTTNKLNGFIYIGIHTTRKLEDGYIGSGRTFLKAVKEHGKENFTREILHRCESREEAEEIERKLVDREFLKRPDVYNRMIGGQNFSMCGMIPVLDKDGNTIIVFCDDPRLKTGEINHFMKGRKLCGKARENIKKAAKNRKMNPNFSKIMKEVWVKKLGNDIRTRKEKLPPHLKGTRPNGRGLKRSQETRDRLKENKIKFHKERRINLSLTSSML